MTTSPHPARTAAALLVASALILSMPAPAPATTLGADGNPITNDAGATFGVLAHRGGAAEWPENSLEAFTNSVASGFDAIETDIVFTKDGHGVMSHNDSLPDRCTGTGRSVHRMTLAQVQQVRCANLAGAKVVPIPTFEELAGVLSGHPEVQLDLEIKTYSGQSASGKRSWAKQAVQLVESHGLIDQTSFVTFNWEVAAPVIKRYAPDNALWALDKGAMDLDRVRLAARLGVDAYGTRMKYSSAYLASYVEQKGMSFRPWQVSGTEQLSFAIAYGGARQLILTDAPTTTRRDLIEGRIDVNPVGVPTTTGLTRPATISRTTYRAKRKHYPAVGTAIVPSAGIPMLRDVTLSITVKGGTGTGYLSVGAASSPLSSSVKVALPKGTSTLTVQAPLGDHRKLRIYTTRTVRLTVRVTGYTRVRFA